MIVMFCSNGNVISKLPFCCGSQLSYIQVKLFRGNIISLFGGEFWSCTLKDGLCSLDNRNKIIIYNLFHLSQSRLKNCHKDIGLFIKLMFMYIQQLKINTNIFVSKFKVRQLSMHANAQELLIYKMTVDFDTSLTLLLTKNIKVTKLPNP